MVKLLDFPPIPKDEQVTGGLLARMLDKISNAIRSPGPARETVRKVTADTTVLPNDAYLFVDTTAGPVTITLPLASTMLNARIAVKLIGGASPVVVTRTFPDQLFGSGLITSISWTTVGDSVLFQAVVDATLGRWHVSANYTTAPAVVAGPAMGSYDPGTISVAANNFLFNYKQLRLTTTERVTMTGAATAIVTDLGNTPPLVLGAPRSLSVPFTVPDCYFFDLVGRLTLGRQVRGTLLGTAQLIATDDTATRSRFVGVGRGY